MAAAPEEEEPPATVLSRADLSRLVEEATRRSRELLDAQGIGSADWEAQAAAARDAANDPDLWGDPGQAQEVMLRVKKFEAGNRRKQQFSEAEDDMRAALELAEDDDDELVQEARETYAAWDANLSRMEVEVLMSGRFDAMSCQVSIFAGAGGNEACDWVCMLEDMYGKYSEQKSWEVTVTDETMGDSFGKKSVEFEVAGEFAYGSLRGEEGTHRLVRVWNGKRQTTFAGVEVVPIVPDGALPQVELADKDLTITTMRSSGPGGQKVNKTESAVRIVHEPTGITVKCKEERSQATNKSKALKKLKEKLAALQDKLQAEEISGIRGDLVKAMWGAQVRNYVLAPYTLVKDTRSGHERTDAGRVLDGDLDSHIGAYLRHDAARRK